MKALSLTLFFLAFVISSWIGIFRLGAWERRTHAVDRYRLGLVAIGLSLLLFVASARMLQDTWADLIFPLLVFAINLGQIIVWRARHFG